MFVVYFGRSTVAFQNHLSFGNSPEDYEEAKAQFYQNQEGLYSSYTNPNFIAFDERGWVYSNHFGAYSAIVTVVKLILLRLDNEGDVLRNTMNALSENGTAKETQKMDSLYIVMPAYNEAENIESVVSSWYPVLSGKSENSRLIIADSGSTDETHKILQQLSTKYDKLKILSDTGKFHGEKLMALYNYAIINETDYVFQTDSDGQTDPDEFASFWEMRKDYDGIFGHRQIREDGKLRDFVERVVCFLLKIFFGVTLPDANAPFRLMKTDTLKKYLYKLPDDYNLPNIMLATYFVFYKEKTAFRKITFKPRQGGKNSINFSKIIKIGWKALGDFRRLRKEMTV